MNRKTIIIIAIVLAVLLVGGFIASRFVDIPALFSGGQEAVIEEYNFPIEGSILTNIKNSRKFVKCELVVLLEDQAEYENIRSDMFKIKDLVIEILRAMEEQEYLEDELQKTLSDKIIFKLNEELGYESVTRIYFKQLITQ